MSAHSWFILDMQMEWNGIHIIVPKWHKKWISNQDGNQKQCLINYTVFLKWEFDFGITNLEEISI